MPVLGFLFMLSVSVGVFLLLRMWLPWGLALVVAAGFLYGWFRLNQRVALRGSGILRSYFMTRRAGGTHEEAIRMAVESRYFTAAKRAELLDQYRDVVENQPVTSEADQLRTLARIIFWSEHGFPPADLDFMVEHQQKLNGELQRLSAKFGIRLAEKEPASPPETKRPNPAPSVGIMAVISCDSCGKRMRVPTDRGRLRVRCSSCGGEIDFSPNEGM
jgi:hypothetical protein